MARNLLIITSNPLLKFPFSSWSLTLCLRISSCYSWSCLYLHLKMDIWTSFLSLLSVSTILMVRDIISCGLNIGSSLSLGPRYQLQKICLGVEHNIPQFASTLFVEELDWLLPQLYAFRERLYWQYPQLRFAPLDTSCPGAFSALRDREWSSAKSRS